MAAQDDDARSINPEENTTDEALIDPSLESASLFVSVSDNDLWKEHAT